MIHVGDCLDVMRAMADCSVDAIVTDPPYGLSFMGKRWDYDVPSVEIWAECLRVLKPGGHLLAFAGTRTQHRMAVRIEDAGFEIRDMIAWVYGSGFPKSLDVSKAIDKKANEFPLFDAIRQHLRFWRDTRGLNNRALNEAVGSATNGCGMARHWTSDEGGQHSIPSKDQWAKLKAVLDWPDCELDAAYSSVKDGVERPIVGQYRAACDPFGQRTGSEAGNITAPATEAARQWAGWGTALKPALEPITVARKPLEGTVAANVQAHGTGGLNIDGCRVGYLPDERVQTFWNNRGGATINVAEGQGTKPRTGEGAYDPGKGRWPANLIHDGSEEVVGLFPVSKDGVAVRSNAGGNTFGGNNLKPPMQDMGYGGGGSAARFFYCAKASKRDRGEDNRHPTVKPTDLMRYLCRLVTPPGGLILDPFAGSGSTGKAAVMEGFGFVGIEREAEYARIAEARVRAARPGLPLEAA